MRRKWLVTLLVLVVPVLIMTACDPPPPTNWEDGPGRTQSVAVVGDSVTAMSYYQLRDSLSAYRNSVTGLSGFTMGKTLDTGEWVQEAAKPPTDAIVIELGGNNLPDVVPGPDGTYVPGPTADAISLADLVEMYRVLVAVKDVPCAIWVVPDFRPNEPNPNDPDHPYPGVVWDLVDKGKVAFTDMRTDPDPDHEVPVGRLQLLRDAISWIQHDPVYGPEVGGTHVRVVDLAGTDYNKHLLPADGIHPDAQGMTIYAERVRTEVEACLADLPSS